MSDKPYFSMSKYATHRDLLEAKVKYYEERIEELEAQLKKREADIQVMVAKAASKHLPAYREQGEKLLAQQLRIEELERLLFFMKTVDVIKG